MYKILILYNSDHNLWKQYGTITDIAPKNATSPLYSFTEFETDDIEVLKTEILKLNEKFGNDQIKIYKDVTANFSVKIVK